MSASATGLLIGHDLAASISNIFALERVARVEKAEFHKFFRQRAATIFSVIVGGRPPAVNSPLNISKAFFWSDEI
jgi:hypothetical protein